MRRWSRLLAFAALAASACSSQPKAALTVVSVQQLGPMEKPATINGRDGGTSGRFAGRSVWVYGDSVATAQGTYPSTWRNNTMSWTMDLDAFDGITGMVQPTDTLGAAREFFPRTTDEESFNAAHIDLGDGKCAMPCGARYAIWGSGPLEDPARNRALLLIGKVFAQPGDFNFSIIGGSVAVWQDFDTGPTRPTVDAGLADPTMLFDAVHEGEWEIPAIDGDYFYAYSCSGAPGDGQCRLARVGLDDVLHRAAWTFWNGSAWSANVGDAVGLFQGSPNLTVNWNAHLNRWLAVYLDWGTIVARTAEHLEGPWSDKATLFQPSEDNPEQALEHAEYQEADGGVIYVSYLADTFRLLRVALAPQ
jgi:hypothetical protein